MPVASSVDSYINAQPEVILSKDQFWQSNKDSYYTGSAVKAPEHYNDFNFKVAKFFRHGPENRFESDYDAYLENLKNMNEFKATQSAREYEDSKVQRLMRDYERAGLNPYMIVNDSGVSVSSSPTSAKADYSASSKKEEKSSKSRDGALIILALARLAAALL